MGQRLSSGRASKPTTSESKDTNKPTEEDSKDGPQPPDGDVTFESCYTSDFTKVLNAPEVNVYAIQFNENNTGVAEAELEKEKLKGLRRIIEASLRSKYLNRQLPRVPWMQDLILPIDEYFVDVALSRGWGQIGVQTNDTFTIERLLSEQDDGVPFRVLIEGGPGFGKTTLAFKLAHDWAKGEDYLSEFDLMVVLHLRDLQLHAGNLKSMILETARVPKEADEDILRAVDLDPQKSLLILEGLDEISSTDFKRLTEEMSGTISSLTTVVALSRPLTNHQQFDRVLTIQGFLFEQQFEFVAKFFEPETNEEQKDKIKQFISVGMCFGILQCPLLLWFFCILVLNDALHLPCSRSALFQDFFDFLVGRHLSSTSPDATVDLFGRRGESGPKEYVAALKNFGCLIGKKLKERKFYFTEEEIKDIQGGELILQLDLLVQKTAVVRKRLRQLWEPIHASIAEFLWIFYFTSSDKCVEEMNYFLKLRDYSSANNFLGLFFLIGLSNKNQSKVGDILMRLSQRQRSAVFPLLYEEYELTRDNGVPSLSMATELTLDITAAKGEPLLLLPRLAGPAEQAFRKVIMRALNEEKTEVLKLLFFSESEQINENDFQTPLMNFIPETCRVPQVVIRNKDCTRFWTSIIDTVSLICPASIKIEEKEDSQTTFPSIFIEDLGNSLDFNLKRLELCYLTLRTVDLIAFAQTELVLNKIEELCLTDVKQAAEEMPQYMVKVSQKHLQESLETLADTFLDYVIKLSNNEPIEEGATGGMLQNLIGTVLSKNQENSNGEAVATVESQAENDGFGSNNINFFFKPLFEILPKTNLVIFEVKQLGLTQQNVEFLCSQVRDCESLQEFGLAENDRSGVCIDLVGPSGLCSGSRKWRRLAFENIGIEVSDNTENGLQIMNFKHRGTNVTSDTMSEILKCSSMSFLDCEGDYLLGMALDNDWLACKMLTELRVRFVGKFSELCNLLSSLQALRVFRWEVGKPANGCDLGEYQHFFKEKPLDLFEIEVETLEDFSSSLIPMLSLVVHSMSVLEQTEKLRLSSFMITLNDNSNSLQNSISVLMMMVEQFDKSGLDILCPWLTVNEENSNLRTMLLEKYQGMDMRIVETNSTFSWMVSNYI